MVGRFFPDPVTEEGEHEVAALVKAVGNNVPGLIEELAPSFAQRKRLARQVQRPNIHALNVGGPILNRCIQVFGAKLGFALHYSKTSRIVPPAGGVAVMWYTNYDRIIGRVPSQVLAMMGPPESLNQGTMTVADQFSFAFVGTPDLRSTVYFSVFRQSFAVLSWVAEDVGAHFGNSVDTIHRPGCLAVGTVPVASELPQT